MTSRECTLITVAGIERKVGATHFAFSLAAKASDGKRNCGLLVSKETFELMNHYFVLKTQSGRKNKQSEERRFASLGSVTLMCGTLPGDVEGFDVLVWDCSTLSQAGRCFTRGNLCCLVAGGQPWELGVLNEVLSTKPYEELEQMVLCLRGIGEDDFVHIKRQMAGRLRCLSVMHKPDWADGTLREDLTEALRYVGL